MKQKKFYGVDDPIGPIPSILGGIQHVLSMFVGIITPPLIVANAIGLDTYSTSFLVSMSLLSSGITTFIQVRRMGLVGSGLLSVQGTSFTFVSLSIQAGNAGGLPLIFGMTLAAAPVEMILSRFIHLARRLFPPIVTGSVVMLIGISLIKVGIVDLAGGAGAANFGSPLNLALGFGVMAVIIILNQFGSGMIGSISIALGIVIGYLIAALVGMVDFSPLSGSGWLIVPQPLRFGLSFDFRYLIPWVIGYFITTIESIGDLSASSYVSRQPVEGPAFIRRLEGGILADGIGSFLAGLFNSMPNTTFSQNNGVIGLTGVASRRVGYAVSGLLVLLGIFPRLATLITVMPKPVLGGATVIMFSMVAVAGFRIIYADGINPRQEFIMAVTLAIGLGVSMVPEIFSYLNNMTCSSPILEICLSSLTGILQSGLALGAITATILNLILPAADQGTTKLD